MGWDTAEQGFRSVTTPTYIGFTNQLEPWWGYWILTYGTGSTQMKFPKP